MEDYKLRDLRASHTLFFGWSFFFPLSLFFFFSFVRVCVCTGSAVVQFEGTTLRKGPQWAQNSQITMKLTYPQTCYHYHSE